MLAYNKGWDDHRAYVTENPDLASAGKVPPELPPCDVGIAGQVKFAYSAEALRSYAEEAVKQEREPYRELVEAYRHGAMSYEEFINAIRARSEQGKEER